MTPHDHPASSVMDDYHALLLAKRVAFVPRGFEPPADLNPALKPHQRHAVEFALRAGCAALFLDTGLGKTLCALEWGRCVVRHTGRPVLMLAPLAVGPQHEREGVRWGIPARFVRDGSQVTGPGIWITNYDRLEMFDPSAFGGVIIDESSILKSFSGATTRALIAAFSATPYRLACTATPAPNDHMELGQHAEFLGIMRGMEMLSRWFVNDTSTASQHWRVKGHARDAFWDWVASWARCVTLPSDLGFDDTGYDLPPMEMLQHVVAADRTIGAGADAAGQARLFRIPETSATSIHREKRLTIDARADALAAVVAADPTEPWVLWCDTDAEADALCDRIPDAVEVRGSMKADVKESRLVAFSTGRARVIVTKPSIAGYGLNWQHAARVGFVGLSFSYESFYQAVRRCHRFGQTRHVQVHVAMADTEKAVWDVVSRKASDHDDMKAAMRAAMGRACQPTHARAPYVARRNVDVPDWMRAA